MIKLRPPFRQNISRQPRLEFREGEVIAFHPDNPVYAKVVPFEEYKNIDIKNKIPYIPRKKYVDIGEVVCLMTASGLYMSMPATALSKVDPQEEIKKLQQIADDVKYKPKSRHTDMLLYSLDMNISFLEKAVKY